MTKTNNIYADTIKIANSIETKKQITNWYNQVNYELAKILDLGYYVKNVNERGIESKISISYLLLGKTYNLLDKKTYKLLSKTFEILDHLTKGIIKNSL